jgi:predicted phosphoribosyltransferase
MVLENTSLFLDMDQAVHQIAERMTGNDVNDFLVVVLSRNVFPVADQMAKRVGLNIFFLGAERFTGTIDPLNENSVVNFDYNTINDSGRDLPRDFIYHQEQNLRANLVSIYAEMYKSVASKFPANTVILVDELRSNGKQFLPSLAKQEIQETGKINESLPAIIPGAARNDNKPVTLFVFLHMGNEDSVYRPFQGFDIIVEKIVGTPNIFI